MRLLLDTHIWIWSLISPERLSPEVRRALSGPDHELWLSAISVWETLVLIRKSRLAVMSADGRAWVAEALANTPVRGHSLHTRSRSPASNSPSTIGTPPTASLQRRPKSLMRPR